MDGLFYLASPYSHSDPSVREKRFVDACRYAGKIMNCGLHVFSPIAHCHPIAAVSVLPTDWKFWQEYDHCIMKACRAMIILCLDGWDKSIGISEEIRLAEQFQLPMYKIQPADSIEVQVHGIKFIEEQRTKSCSQISMR